MREVDIGGCVTAVDVMMAVVGPVVMIVLADNDGHQYVDKSNESLVSVMVTTAAEVAAVKVVS